MFTTSPFIPPPSFLFLFPIISTHLIKSTSACLLAQQVLGNALTFHDALKNLRNCRHAWATEAIERMKKGNADPLALKVVFEQIMRAREMDFDDCLRMEFAATCSLAQKLDYRGIREPLTH